MRLQGRFDDASRSHNDGSRSYDDASRSKEKILSLIPDPSKTAQPLLFEKRLQYGIVPKYNYNNIKKIIESTQRSDFFNSLYYQIIGLTSLTSGWDSYDAEPPNYKASTNALKVLGYLFQSDFKPTRIMPSVEGGISFLFIQNIKYADIECDNDGDILAGMSDRIGEPILWEVSEEKGLRVTISQIRSFLET